MHSELGVYDPITISNLDTVLENFPSNKHVSVKPPPVPITLSDLDTKTQNFLYNKHVFY